MKFIWNLIGLFGLLVLALIVAAVIQLGPSINNLAGFDEKALSTYTEIGKALLETGSGPEATVWKIPVAEGLTPQEVEETMRFVANEHNIKNVGELPLSEELKARGIQSDTVYVMSFCNPETARKMLDFSPAMGGFLPCRITIVGKTDPETGKEKLTLYSMNMDMMVKMGKKLPPDLKKAAMQVRDTIWEMLEKGAAGDF